jgi:hypothetical protein
VTKHMVAAMLGDGPSVIRTHVAGGGRAALRIWRGAAALRVARVAAAL